MSIETRHLTAADGTQVGYHVLGSGAPIVIVHGSIAGARHWLAVAERLADRHTCYVLDRRGRGASGDHADYTLATEASDIVALLDVAGKGATLVGHSYGGICTLEAVRLGAQPARLALYEPPLPYASPTAGAYLEPYAEAIARDDREAAMQIACDHFLRIPPEEQAGLKASPLWPDILELAPTWTRELREIDLTVDRLEAYAALSLPTLLLVGERSPSHLTGASAWLQERMPDARTMTLAGQGHVAYALDPGALAGAVRAFVEQTPIRNRSSS